MTNRRKWFGALAALGAASAISGADSTQMAKPVLEGHVKDNFTGDGTTATFQLSFLPTAPAALFAFVDGLYQTEGADYSITGKSVTFAQPAIPSAAAKVAFAYRAQFNG